MDLILWRHAVAVAKRDDRPDLDRALTRHGERQAERVAAWLNRHLPPRTRVIVSPARRTQQTAAPLDRRWHVEPALAPDTSVDALLAAARWPDARTPVLVVGHQPTLGLTAARLLAGQDLAWSMRKAGVWWLRGREREGVVQATWHAAITADFV